MSAPSFDPLPFLRGLVTLRRLTGMYPHGHPLIAQKADEVCDLGSQLLAERAAVTIDIIHGELHVAGTAFRSDSASAVQAIQDMNELGVQSVQIQHGLDRDELTRAAEFLSVLAQHPQAGLVAPQLAARGITHITFARILPLDTRWRTRQWDDGPAQPLDPAYAESLARTEDTFQSAASGRPIDAITIRQLVQLLIGEVARSSAAMAQILALKEYENLTYCHSVNVAILSLMLGRQLELDDATITALVEVALLHDIGKTRVPLEIVQKPSALDRAERKLIEAHTTYGAQILVGTAGVNPFAATVALEHHRGVHGTGYPDLGEGVVPHVLSQIVSVADIYEALTGARSYREPMRPEQACLVLARESGRKLNTAFVKAFVSAVTFFPVGSVVRTSRDETGIVVRTNPKDPLHPIIALTSDRDDVLGEVDTAERDESGRYVRQIVQTLPARPHTLELTLSITK